MSWTKTFFLRLTKVAQGERSFSCSCTTIDREIKLWNKEFELMGSDKIAYNQQNYTVNEDKLSPEWRAGNKVYISPDTRIKCACRAEMPVEVEEIRINGDCSDVHTISVTDEMRFPNSELPITSNF
jgi:hypothetical protein